MGLDPHWLDRRRGREYRIRCAGVARALVAPSAVAKVAGSSAILHLGTGLIERSGKDSEPPPEQRPKRWHPHGGEIGARRIEPSQLKEDGLCLIGQGGLCGQEGQTTTAKGERGKHARLIKRACGWGDTGVHSPQLLP